METIVVIPARKGSKGVPNKNKKLLDGKSLISYTIQHAKEIFDTNQIFLTTNDDEVLNIAKKEGLNTEYKRPDYLSQDNTGMYEVLIDILEYIEKQGSCPKIMLLLQPTSPFRTPTQIQEALSLFSLNIDMVVSVKESKSNPYYNLYEDNNEGFLIKSKNAKFVTRQSSPKIWEYNGAIYVINIASLKKRPLHTFEKNKKYIMDEETSHDIDTMFDWSIAELLIKNKVLNSDKK